MTATLDRLARPMRDLRISVTDRCNFRCGYCMPKEVFGPDFAFLPRNELLSFEEITRLARLFIEQGVTKIRLTGGEPLLRRDIERLVEMLARLDGITDIAMTTNGALLARKARALAEAGLTRVTVSLDALDDGSFGAMNDVGFRVERVLAGIDAAADAGMAPIKVNMVVRRALNQGSVMPMAEHFRHTGHVLRFIEFMDVGTTNRWSLDDVATAQDILGMVGERWPVEELPPSYPGEVATRYRYLDGGGEIGLIASVTKPFCGACTRARLSAEGRLHTCLFASGGHDLRALLRGESSDADIAARLRSVWSTRADRYSEERGPLTRGQPKIEMSYIGG